MTYIVSFVISVMASVVGNYISKWIDRSKPDISQEEPPGSCSFRGVRLRVLMNTVSLVSETIITDKKGFVNTCARKARRRFF